MKEEAGKDILVLEDFEITVELAQSLTEDDVVKEAQNLAKSASSGVIDSLKTLPRAFQNIDYLELILALLIITIIFGFKRITTAVPSTLVVSLGAYFMNLDYRPIQEIPGGFPLPHFEIFSDFKLDMLTPYIFTALTLALLGCIDSLLTSVVADNMTRTRHNPNKELVAQGIGNSIAAIFWWTSRCWRHDTYRDQYQFWGQNTPF